MLLRAAALCLALTGASAWWRDEDTRTRGEAPYPFPAQHKDGTAPVYQTRNEKDGPIEAKINVHLVPHTVRRVHRMRPPPLAAAVVVAVAASLRRWPPRGPRPPQRACWSVAPSAGCAQWHPSPGGAGLERHQLPIDTSADTVACTCLPACLPAQHDDTGWQVTVDQYFFSEVYYVVDTVVDQLLKDPKRHFIYVETGFFARWWDEQPDARRDTTRGLVENGQLEFINGAWCMHDEASPFYVEMIDQTTRGHQFLRKNFGEAAIPRGTWQIDPFGHSNTEAWLLGAEAGMESLYWGRTDYQDMRWRTSHAGQSHNQWPEWVWQGSESLGKSAEVFAGQRECDHQQLLFSQSLV
jgi:hypothetical protein